MSFLFLHTGKPRMGSPCPSLYSTSHARGEIIDIGGGIVRAFGSSSHGERKKHRYDFLNKNGDFTVSIPPLPVFMGKTEGF